MSTYTCRNVSVLMYHLVFPAKYRRVIFEERIEEELKEACLEIEKRYEFAYSEYLAACGGDHLLCPIIVNTTQSFR